MSKTLDQIYVANPITSNASTDLMYFSQSPYTAGKDAGMTYANFAAQFGVPYTPAALTEISDTNVTLTLGGTPTTSLLHAVSITAGWTGTLSGTRGGTGVNNGASTMTIGGNFAMSGAYTFTGTLTGNTGVTFPTSGTLATTSQLPTPAALTEVSDTNVTLTLGGTPTTSLLQATSITAGWSGELSLARGGTNNAITASAGGIVWSDATKLNLLSGTVTANQVLLSGDAATPAWSTATYPATTTINQLLYSSSANVIAGLSTLDNGVLITGATGIPALLANSGTAGYVLTANTGAPPSWQAVPSGGITTIDGDSGSITGTTVTISGGSTGLTTSGSVATMDLTGTLNLASGGTNANLTASNGGIFYSTASAGAILAGTATASQVLLSGASTTPAWSTATYPGTTTVNQLLYSSSNNVVSGLATADSATIYTTTAGVPAFTAAMTNGQLLIGSTSNNPVLSTLTAGTNVGISNSTGSITISCTAALIPWTNVASNTQAMAVANGYITNNGSTLVTYTLPAIAAQGTVMSVSGYSAGGWKIAQNALQSIVYGSVTTTVGTGGSLASTNAGNQVSLLCVVANTTWTVLNSQGTLTYV